LRARAAPVSRRPMTTTHATIQAELAQAARDFDGHLSAWVDQWSAHRIAPQLAEAMRYSLLAGGKRLRPVLTLWSCDACGSVSKTAINAAFAIECVHTFSLIHDDLPALDDDDLRRGQPTCHKKFGEATAILAGDGLLTLAFEALGAAKLPAERVVALTRELADATGPAGMIGGEWLDLDAEGRAFDEDDVQRIHTFKTARLIRSACRLGGICAGASREQLNALSGYGKSLGLAFQIADDVLDVEGDPARMGKRTNKDDARGKPTYPAAVGVEKSKTIMRDLAKAAEDHLSAFGTEANRLRALARYVIERVA